ncbi:NUDIX domain-containing protein [Candidatus Woesearchaeota archaeon]|nr:NUDIX domain-containing protein [Candidatus Woesearchaeota archaeon]
MADELIDICDENNNFLNVKKMKSEAHKNGLWHRASHIWIYNSKGEILLQLRAKEKLLYPDMWDISAAGHISAGEDPFTSGLREVEEEIGLKLKKEDLNFWMIRKVKTIFREIKNNEFYYIYFFNFDGDVNQLKLQKEEVQKIQFIPIDKIEEELKINPSKYVPHGNYWFEVLNEIKNRIIS